MKLPIELNGCRIFDSDGDFVFLADFGCDEPIEQRLILHYIVTAVNSHDELLEACKVMRDYMDGSTLGTNPIQMIRDAIAKAEPEGRQ